MSLRHELLLDHLVGLYLGTGQRKINCGTTAATIATIATGAALLTASVKHSHGLKLHSQHIGHGEVVEALILHRVAIGILEDEHPGGLVEDVLGRHDILLGKGHQCLLGGFGQLFLQGNARHRGTNLALHSVAFEFTLVLGFEVFEVFLQFLVDLLCGGVITFVFLKVSLQLLIALSLGNVIFQLGNLGSQALVGGLVTSTLIGRGFEDTKNTGHIIARFLTLIALDSTLSSNRGV